MHTSIKILLITLFLAVWPALSPDCQAQSSVLTEVRNAIKAGSSREVTKHFDDMVELDIVGKSGNYTKEQATFVLKEFFDKYPSSDFQFIHQGASKVGSQYAIGRYSHESGHFRVFMLVNRDNYKIKLLNIAEE